VLRAVYYGKEKEETEIHWQSKVIAQIQNLGPPALIENYMENLSSLLWQLVPGTCILILILGLVFFNIEFIPRYEITRWLIEESSELSVWGQFL